MATGQNDNNNEEIKVEANAENRQTVVEEAPNAEGQERQSLDASERPSVQENELNRSSVKDGAPDATNAERETVHSPLYASAEPRKAGGMKTISDRTAFFAHRYLDEAKEKGTDELWQDYEQNRTMLSALENTAKKSPDPEQAKMIDHFKGHMFTDLYCLSQVDNRGVNGAVNVNAAEDSKRHGFELDDMHKLFGDLDNPNTDWNDVIKPLLKQYPPKPLSNDVTADAKMQVFPPKPGKNDVTFDGDLFAQFQAFATPETVETPEVQEPKVEEVKVDEVTVDAPEATVNAPETETVEEQTLTQEQPTVETPAVEEPVVEESAVEKPVAEEIKTETLDAETQPEITTESQPETTATAQPETTATAQPDTMSFEAQAEELLNAEVNAPEVNEYPPEEAQAEETVTAEAEPTTVEPTVQEPQAQTETPETEAKQPEVNEYPNEEELDDVKQPELQDEAVKPEQVKEPKPLTKEEQAIQSLLIPAKDTLTQEQRAEEKTRAAEKMQFQVEAFSHATGMAVDPEFSSRLLDGFEQCKQQPAPLVESAFRTLLANEYRNMLKMGLRSGLNRAENGQPTASPMEIARQTDALMRCGCEYLKASGVLSESTPFPAFGGLSSAEVDRRVTDTFDDLPKRYQKGDAAEELAEFRQKTATVGRNEARTVLNKVVKDANRCEGTKFNAKGIDAYLSSRFAACPGNDQRARQEAFKKEYNEFCAQAFDRMASLPGSKKNPQKQCYNFNVFTMRIHDYCKAQGWIGAQEPYVPYGGMTADQMHTIQAEKVKSMPKTKEQWARDHVKTLDNNAKSNEKAEKQQESILTTLARERREREEAEKNKPTVDQEVNNIVANLPKRDDLDEPTPELNKAIAFSVELNQQHARRSAAWKLFHPIQNRHEKENIEKLNKAFEEKGYAVRSATNGQYRWLMSNEELRQDLTEEYIANMEMAKMEAERSIYAEDSPSFWKVTQPLEEKPDVSQLETVNEIVNPTLKSERVNEITMEKKQELTTSTNP